jgi:mRNA-degrading endonuclease RelE of RelBE toxin-antitoxin system
LPFEIQYAAESEEHLRGLTANQKAQVLDGIAEQLVHQPNVPTRNRKSMRANKLANWELRIGTLRVYYDVQEQPQPVVHIRAVGIKQGNRVFVHGEEVKW